MEGSTTRSPETTPRFHGRKRKSEITPTLENVEKPTEQASKRGRTRKSIDYYDLANPGELEENDEKPKPRNNQAFKKKGKSAENLQKPTEITRTNPEVTEENPGENSEKNMENCTGPPGPVKEGETTKMMKTLFSHYKAESCTPIQEPVNANSSETVCAVCHKAVAKTAWNYHKQRFHNNLAWKMDEPPLDLTDQSFVMATLKALYKRRKPLYCCHCGSTKKSVVGFLSHQAVCQISEEKLEEIRSTCELCGKKMLPVSLTSHMKMCHSPSKPEKIRLEKQPELDLGAKRSAAKKALSLISDVTRNLNDEYFTEDLDFSAEFAEGLLLKELENNEFAKCKFSNCQFQSDNLVEIQKHLSICDQKTIGACFMCKKCLFISTDAAELIGHLESIHRIKWDDNDPCFNRNSEDFDGNSKPTVTVTSSVKLPKFLKSSIPNNRKVLFPPAFKWTLKFHEENSGGFQEDFPSVLSLLPRHLVSAHLPKTLKSCQVAETQTKHFSKPKQQPNLASLNLFEAKLQQHTGNCTVFCGGPVTAIAWTPTPHNVQVPQVLAVSVQNLPDKKYLLVENYHEKSVIQFWNFGCLNSKERNDFVPEFYMGLAVEFAPVWHMEWCFGGYSPQMGRLGLLAVTGSDGVVYIYSIPLLSRKKTRLFYKAKPSIKLVLHKSTDLSLGEVSYYPTRLSWSKVKGQSCIVVGYSNGLIALFNLKTESPLLAQTLNGVVHLFPYKYFPAHTHSVTALVLHHLNGGCRWLISGSLDRFVCLWDLNDVNYPVSKVRKNIITDGIWMTNWLCSMFGFDEASTKLNVSTTIKQAFDYLFDTNSLLFSSATISSISASDWLNGVLQANTVGEVLAVFPHQLMYSSGNKSLKDRRMVLSHTRLLSNNEKKADAVTYEQVEQKYGLLFCDNKIDSYENLKDSSDKLGSFSKEFQQYKPNEYPMQTANKIAFNPNGQACLYYVTGYQMGFLRLTWLKCLKSDPAILF